MTTFSERRLRDANALVSCIAIIVRSCVCTVTATTQPTNSTHTTTGYSRSARHPKRTAFCKCFAPPNAEAKAKQDAAEHNENRQFNRDTIFLTELTIGIIFFQLLIFVVQAIYLRGTLLATAKAANAAKKAAKVAERALVAVERPILVVSLPQKYVPVVGRPKFEIEIENVGKQVASTNAITAHLVIQADSNFPAIMPNDGSSCTTIPVVGQLVVKPTNSIKISCQRQRPITADEIGQLSSGKLYTFFNVGIIYIDPIGNSRVSNWVGLHRPSGKFVQIFSSDLAKQKSQSPEEHQNVQQVLIDTILTIERKRGFPFPDE